MPFSDEIEELDPSASSHQDETTASTPAPGADQSGQQSDDAGSSAATGENQDADLLSVVRDVVDESRKDQTASPAEGEVDGQKTGDTAPKEPDNEAFSDVPFHKHPRFQQLLRQRNGFKQDAERYNNVQTFLDNNGLSAEEAADGLILMSMMKTNPVEAWKRMKPTIQKLLVAAGEVLPDDLRQMVQEGKMDEAAALEVSRSRAGVASVQVQRSFEQQQRDRQTQRQSVQALGGAANDWEADRRKKDPNFDKKFVPLQKEILFLQQTEGRPNTPEGVRAQLDKAYAAVNASLKPAQPRDPQTQRFAGPKKPELKPVTGGQVAGNSRPAPNSTLDIVRANRRSA